LRTPKNYNNPLKLRGQSYKRGLWFFVSFVEAVTRGNENVLSSCFFILSSGAMVSRTLGYGFEWVEGFT
jgi:hypothetical protein